MDNYQQSRIWSMDVMIKLLEGEVVVLKRDSAPGADIARKEIALAAKKQELNDLCESLGVVYGRYGGEPVNGDTAAAMHSDDRAPGSVAPVVSSTMQDDRRAPGTTAPTASFTMDDDRRAPGTDDPFTSLAVDVGGRAPGSIIPNASSTTTDDDRAPGTAIPSAMDIDGRTPWLHNPFSLFSAQDDPRAPGTDVDPVTPAIFTTPNNEYQPGISEFERYAASLERRRGEYISPYGPVQNGNPSNFRSFDFPAPAPASIPPTTPADEPTAFALDYEVVQGGADDGDGGVSTHNNGNDVISTVEAGANGEEEADAENAAFNASGEFVPGADFVLYPGEEQAEEGFGH